MVMDGLMLIGISLCLLLQVPGTGGQATQLPQTQDIGAILNRLSNLEFIFLEERYKTVSMQNELAKIKSQTLSVQRPVYDDEFIKSYVSEVITNTLDTIQDGLVSEKQQRLRLENMALEIKDIVNKQNDNHKLLEEKTKQSENRIKALERTRSAVPTTAQAKPTTRPAFPTARPVGRTARPVRQTARPDRQTPRPVRRTSRPVRRTARPVRQTIRPARPTIRQPFSPPKPTTVSPNPPIVGRVKFSGQPGNQFDNRNAKDCEHIREFGYSDFGVYRVYIKPDSPVLVYCSPETSQMVVQWRRGEVGGRKQNFNKTWDEYKYGFGSFDSDFWIGTEILFQIINSSSGDTELRMELTNRPYTNDSPQWLTIFNAQLSNEGEGYKLRYSHLTKSHRFYFQDQIPGNGYTFMTRDRQSRGSNCPDINGGWWYQRSLGCPVTPSNPNSPFINVTHPSHLTHHLGYYSNQASRHNIRTTVTATKLMLDYRNRN